MANVKFSEFPSAATVGATDIIPILQGGVNKKATALIFSDYIGSAFVGLTGNQTVAGVKTFSSQLISTVAIGTAPFSVVSTTKVTNLNADLLDGLSSADFASAASLSSYLPLAGGTLTGALNGTSAVFSSLVTAGNLIQTSYGTARIQVTSTTNSANSALRFGAKNASGTTKNAGLYYVSGATSADTFMSFAADDTNYQFNFLANGNCGIGSTSPTSKLNVIGDIHIGDYGTAAARVLDLRTNNSLFTIATDGTAGGLGTTISYSWANGGQGALKFNNAAGEVMRLSAGGNVLIGTTTDGGSSKLTIDSTTQGVLVPRMTTTQINAIGSPANGLIAYNTTLGVLCFYDGTNWKKVSHSNM